VGARARSKHAHRAVSGPSFFGVAKGSAAQQNKETFDLLNHKLLEGCVWINSHNFGGVSAEMNGNEDNTTVNDTRIVTTNETKQNKSSGVSSIITSSSSWVLEIRQEQGYGARWLLELPATRKNSSMELLVGLVGRDPDRDLVVTFRGFLEPQMENGHDNRWRH